MPIVLPDFVKRFLFKQIKAVEQKNYNLSYLFWECTQKCNLNCLHCGSDCISNSQVKDMPLQDFLKVLDDINQYRHERIIVAITGGEPLLRKDLEQCGFEIRKRGFHWGIVTNGFLYTKERHNSLMNAGMGSITLSLDGTEITHNWLRNHSKSYEKALQAMNLIANESNLNSDIVTCVNRKNIHELEDIFQVLVDNNVRAWRLFTIAPIGRAKDNDLLQLTSDEFTYLMEFISKKRIENRIEVKFSCEGYVGKYEGKVRDGYFFCRAGINIGSVLIDGSIGACPNINRSFVQGNIYTDKFTDIWNNRFQLYRNREWTKTGKCHSCKKYKHCQGNGLHYWDENRENVLQCHYKQLL